MTALEVAPADAPDWVPGAGEGARAAAGVRHLAGYAPAPGVGSERALCPSCGNPLRVALDGGVEHGHTVGCRTRDALPDPTSGDSNGAIVGEPMTVMGWTIVTRGLRSHIMAALPDVTLPKGFFTGDCGVMS